jgi:hypothetical protein
MPTVPFRQFLENLHKQFPNLKQYDETRLFSLLIQAGVNIEFDVDKEGNATITHADISGDTQSKLSQL